MDKLRGALHLIKDEKYSLLKTIEVLSYSKAVKEATAQLSQLDEAFALVAALSFVEENSERAEDIKKATEEYETAKAQVAELQAKADEIEGAKFDRFIDLVRSESNEILNRINALTEEEVAAYEGAIAIETMKELYVGIIEDINNTDSLEYLLTKQAKSKIRNHSGKKMVGYLVKRAKSTLERSKREYLDPSVMEENLKSYTELTSTEIEAFLRNFFMYVINAKVDNEDVFYKVSETISTVVKLPQYKDTGIYKNLELNIRNYLVDAK